MSTHRITTSFITVTVMACCLVLGGFAAPAAAHRIVVTTLADIADPPFNADGLCGTGTVRDLPGADGKVSLREAIIAANNTPGPDTITFASRLKGGTITVNFDDLDADTTPDPLPALCGGDTRIKGTSSREEDENAANREAEKGRHNRKEGDDDDRDGRAVPTITLDGSALPAFVPAAGIGVISSHNTVSGLRVQHFPFGIVVTAVGSDTQIDHTTITDNEVMGNGFFGIFMVSQGDRNVFSHTTIAHNTVASNAFVGITVWGGFGGADENTFETDITDNTVTDNGGAGIVVDAGVDNSSNNHVVARIRGNTVEGGHQNQGIETLAALGAVSFPTGTSNHNVLDVRIERNTVRNQTGGGIFVGAGEGSPDGRAGAVADDNHTRAIVVHNTVEDNTTKGIELDAGVQGLANSNTLEVRVAHNTVCHNALTDIFGEGGFSGDILFPAPNTGTGNVLTGEISKNTATTVTVQNGTPGNTATVIQFKNDSCP